VQGSRCKAQGNAQQAAEKARAPPVQVSLTCCELSRIIL